MPDDQDTPIHDEAWRRSREHRRRRRRRKRRRAFIRSIYSLPSLVTLGNAICGFAAIYIAGLAGSTDWLGAWFADPQHRFVSAAAFIFLAMLCDALDGRLARFTRHTTDFGGQLDSLADMISFGAAPAILAVQFFKSHAEPMELPFALTRSIWAAGALYLSCAAVRLARFNVSNKHGEQHHYSFLGLPSPGAAGAVATAVLLHEHLHYSLRESSVLAPISLWAVPVILLSAALLMVSTLRYPHLINRYLRGKRSVAAVLSTLIFAMLFFIWPVHTLTASVLGYAYSGAGSWLLHKIRHKAIVPWTPPGHARSEEPASAPPAQDQRRPATGQPSP